MIRVNRTAGLVAVVAFAAVGLLAIVALGAPVGGSATASDADPVTIDDHNEDRYSVAQGDRCVQIEPIGDGHRTVDTFYDYRNPFTTPSGWEYSSHGTTHLQEDDTSILFLHEGSDGLSLVIVHDRYDGETDGGAATFHIDGLPEEGEWVVEDDNYSGTIDGTHVEADAEWEHGDDWSRITWVWTEARTDGGAFSGGLDDEFAIEVTPAFNDLADYQAYDGEVNDWQVLSAPEHDPERTSLDMDRPTEIRSGGCAAVTDIEVEETTSLGETGNVTATISNDGIHNETVVVPIAIDGEVVDEREVTVDAGETVTLSTAIAFEEAGDRTVSVGSASADVDVSDSSVPDQIPGFGVLITGMAILAAVILHRRR